MSGKRYVERLFFIIMVAVIVSTVATGIDKLVRNKARYVFAEESGLSQATNKICVDEYYKRATPVNDPELPEGLRWMPFTGRGVDEQDTEITPVEGNAIPLNWDRAGSFSHDLFTSKFGLQIKEILSKHGVNIEKLTNLLKRIGTEKSVSLYDGGFMIIFDGEAKKSYIFKTLPGIAIAFDEIELEYETHTPSRKMDGRDAKGNPKLTTRNRGVKSTFDS